MKARSFLVLCAITLLAVLAAGVAIVRDHRSDVSVGAADKLFPELLDRTDTLAVITLRDAETTLTIQKDGDGWSLLERDGYPVRPEAVRSLVLKLAGLEKVEAKTERPELYSRLGVEDVTAAGARSKEVELRDDEGDVLVRLLAGKSAFGIDGTGGLYVRKPDESRSWLVRGRLAPGLEASDWVDRRIADIPRADVRSVHIRHPDGETVQAARQSIDDEHFALEGLPGAPPPHSKENKEKIDELASVLSALDLEDLRKVGDIGFPEDGTVRATVSTFDGLKIAVDLTEHDGRDWIRIATETAPNGQANEQAAIDAAREIGDRTSVWAYQVSAFAVAPWKKRKAELLKSDTTGH